MEGGSKATAGATLTNTGNGRETFVVTATLGAGAAPVSALAIDTDGDGRFGAADTRLVDGRTPALAPGQSLSLVLVAPLSAGAEAVSLAAAAATGADAPGHVFDGQGDGGGDAVVGASGARATLAIPLDGASATAVTLEKRQSVTAPDGSPRAIRGATITYTMIARFDGAVRAAKLEDPVPVGTSFVAGSLRLDGAALTDGAGDDAGEIAGDQIAVTFGDVAGPGERTVSFQVVIQ